MAPPTNDLISRPCADIPEFQRFILQDYRRAMLMEQTGGGEAFVEAAAQVIRKQVLQALPYASPSSKYVQRLRRSGVAEGALEQALARAWLDSSSEFRLPRSRRRDFFSSTAALAFYSVAAAVAGLIGMVRYLRHAHPDLASAFIAFPPLLAALGVPIVIVLFLALRRIVHRG